MRNLAAFATSETGSRLHIVRTDARRTMCGIEWVRPLMEKRRWDYWDVCGSCRALAFTQRVAVVGGDEVCLLSALDDDGEAL